MMGKDKEPEEFKVVDRRSSSGATDDPTVKGPDFTMKDSPEEDNSPTQIDFPTLVFSLATGALIHLGLAPDPVTKKTQKNVELAKQNIDILSILKEKTKGNLTDEEGKLLESLLTEVRLRFVEASK